MTALTDTLISERSRELLSKKFPERSGEELSVQLEECLKFLTISSELDACFIPLSKEVDDVWHELVVQTRSYADLCQKLPGQHFIHHESLHLAEYVEIVGRKAAVSEFLSWIPRYVSRFGEFDEVRAKYWRVCEFLQREVGLSLEQINAVGRTTPQPMKPGPTSR